MPGSAHDMNHAMPASRYATGGGVVDLLCPLPFGAGQVGEGEGGSVERGGQLQRGGGSGELELGDVEELLQRRRSIMVGDLQRSLQLQQLQGHGSGTPAVPAANELARLERRPSPAPPASVAPGSQEQAGEACSGSGAQGGGGLGGSGEQGGRLVSRRSVSVAQVLYHDEPQKKVGRAAPGACRPSLSMRQCCSVLRAAQPQPTRSDSAVLLWLCRWRLPPRWRPCRPPPGPRSTPLHHRPALSSLPLLFSWVSGAHRPGRKSWPPSRARCRGSLSSSWRRLAPRSAPPPRLPPGSSLSLTPRTRLSSSRDCRRHRLRMPPAADPAAWAVPAPTVMWAACMPSVSLPGRITRRRRRRRGRGGCGGSCMVTRAPARTKTPDAAAGHSGITRSTNWLPWGLKQFVLHSE